MNTITDFIMSDGTRPVVGEIIRATQCSAQHTFLKVVKVNRKSILAQHMTAITVRNADGTPFGFVNGAPSGKIHVIAGDAYGDTFKVDSFHKGLVSWDGQPASAQQIDLHVALRKDIWKLW